MPSVRTWLLRHLARRFQIGEDILAHLSTFQRLGEQFEVEAPQEMLPVGARTLVRALRSRAAPQIRPDWLWPYWLERQLDPHDDAFVPRGHLAFTTNLTNRNWTAVGNLWSPWEAIVDPRGLVTPWFDGWSIDWWVEDDGVWRYPSRDRRVTQSLHSGSLPIVETAMETDGGGDVVQRAYAQVVDDEDIAELVVVDLENRTGRTVRVAAALRPYNPEGLAVLSDIRVRDRQVVVNDNHLALLLPEEPETAVLSTFAEGDTANHLREGLARGAHEGRVEDPAGLAQAAFVYRLEPGETIQLAAPLVPGEEQRRRRGVVDRFTRWPDVTPELQSSSQVAEAWRGVLDRGMQVEVPHERLQQAIDANRAFTLLLHDPGSITPGPFTYHRFWFRDAAYQTVSLDRWGFHEEAADVIRTFPSRQRADGFYYSQWREWDANGAAIWAIAEHHRLTGDDDLLARVAPSVARGARWIARKRRERRRDAPELRGLLPPGVSAEHLGPFDYYYWDDFWSLRGLQDAAYVGYLTGDLQGAADAERVQRALHADTMSSIERSARRIGETAIPAGPTRGADTGMIGSLAACEPLRILDVDDPYVAGTAELIRDRFTIGDAFFQGISHTGLGTYLTLQLASVELEAGDRRAYDRLRWMLDASTPTYTWPEAIHPQLEGGCMGDGHHGWAAADFLSFVRNLLVREGRDGSILLLGLLPDDWYGERVVVRDAPTHRGLVSYTLDWEGDRPVLTWECAEEGVTLRAPGLDPSWSTSERTGSMTFSDVDR